MTLADLKSAVYRTVPEIGEFIDEEALTQLFNECQRLLAFDSRRLAEKEVDVVNGVFTIPSDCLALKSVAWKGTALVPWAEEVLPDIKTGCPIYYYQVGDKCYLIPKSEETDKVSIYYTAKPQDMVSNTDTPAVANSEEVLIAYVLWNAYRIMGDVNNAAIWEKTYIERRQAWFLLDRASNYRRLRVRNVINWR